MQNDADLNEHQLGSTSNALRKRIFQDATTSGRFEHSLGLEDVNNTYELKRMKQIKKNREIFKELGLEKCIPKVSRSKKARRNESHVFKRQRLPLRRSRRFRGDNDVDASPEGIRDLVMTATEHRGRRREEALAKIDPSKYSIPFMLSETLEITSLGECKNSDNPNWWSNPSCLFHHEYPDGYKARKFHWGAWFAMEISASENGEFPVFHVTNQSTNVTKVGDSPTGPWTEFCLMRTGKERVSGPLFFGFSNPIIIKLIQS